MASTMADSGETFYYFQDNSLVPVISSSLAVFVIYFVVRIVKKPEVIANPRNKLIHILNEKCPSSQEKFWPLIWCLGFRVQTIFRALTQLSVDVPYKRELLKLYDGGQVFIDWVENDDDNVIYPDSDSRPTVVFLPGITGSSKENYMLQMVKKATDLGHRCVVFNNRGRGGADIVTPKFYCATDTDDLATVVKHIKARYPNSKVIGAGVSLGGMILMHYLAKYGDKCGLVAAVSISACFNPTEAVKFIEKPINRTIFNYRLARNLVQTVHKNLDMFVNRCNMDHVLKASTLREFDTSFTCKMFGFSSCESYYAEALLNNKMNNIRVPVLCINAADDPFSHISTIDLDAIRQSDHVAMVLTSHGGHIGFLDGYAGIIPRRVNFFVRLFQEFLSTV